MNLSAIIDAMVMAGCTAEQLAAVVKAVEAGREIAATEKRKADAGAWNKIRQQVFLRDGYECLYCGSNGGKFSLEIDHIKPRCQGGSDDLENLAVACKQCNSSKRHRTPEQWGVR